MQPNNLRILFVTKYVSGCLKNEFTYHGEWTDTYELILALKKTSQEIHIRLLTPKIYPQHENRFENEFGKNLRAAGVEHEFADTYLDYGMPQITFRYKIFAKEKEIVRKQKIDILQYGQFAPNFSYRFKKYLGLKKIICYGCYDDTASWKGKEEDEKKKKIQYGEKKNIAGKITELSLLFFAKVINFTAYDKRIDRFVLMHPKGVRLMQQLENIPEEKIRLIPKAHSNPLPAKISKKISGQKRVLFVGMLHRRKGIYDVLEVAIRLPQISFIIAGGGNEILEKEMAKLYKKHKNINYLGPISYSERFTVFKENDVLLLPSYKDAYPSVLLEALSCAMPVITTKQIDSPIEDGKNGLLVSAGNIDEICRAVEKITENGKNYEKLSLEAARSAGQLTWQNAADKFIQLYNEQ